MLGATTSCSTTDWQSALDGGPGGSVDAGPLPLLRDAGPRESTELGSEAVSSTWACSRCTRSMPSLPWASRKARCSLCITWTLICKSKLARSRERAKLARSRASCLCRR